MRFSPRLILLGAAALGAALLILLAGWVRPALDAQQPSGSARTDAERSPNAAESSSGAGATSHPATAATETKAPVETQPSAPAIVDFHSWMDAALAPGSIVAPEALTRGVELAKARRQSMAALMISDPRRALAEAVSPLARQRLPAEVVALLEQPVNARGSFRVVATLSESGGSSAPAIRREFVTPGRTYQAHVFGARLRQPTADNLALNGIALDDHLAVAESPVRVLAAGEKILAGTPVAETCPVSGKTVAAARQGKAIEENQAAEIGGVVHFFCGAGHLAHLVETAGSPPAPDNSYNQGLKKILLVRLNFSDAPAEPMSVATGQAMLAETDAFIAENSYGATRIDLANSVVTPVLITMPKTKAAYRSARDPYSLLQDARAAAAAAGYNYLDYDFEWLRYAPIYGVSQAFVGERGLWLETSNTGSACHEWGHNLGLFHSGLWVTTDDTVIGTGTHSEYGDSYDTMGTANGGTNAFNACQRWLIGWLPNGNVETATASGTYRLFAFDQSTLAPGQTLAVRTQKDALRFYWLEHRIQWPGSAAISNGILLHWSPWAASNGGTELLDAIPVDTTGSSEAALVIGRTFSDSSAGIHITPIARNASTSPPSIDVVIHRGKFPGNRPPALALSASATTAAVNQAVTFTAAASDPDGDDLAYAWDFGNGVLGPNAAAASASWTTAGNYVVRCVVSDIKGQSAARFVTVTVGSPATFTAGGRPSPATPPPRISAILSPSRETAAALILPALCAAPSSPRPRRPNPCARLDRPVGTSR